MTTAPDAQAPAPRASRAGRNLPAAIGSAVVLLVAVGLSLATFDGFPFVVLVAVAMAIGIWELRAALATRGTVLPFEPLQVGSVAMLFGAWFGAAPSLATGLAVTALAVMLWRLRSGVDGFVRDAT